MYFNNNLMFIIKLLTFNIYKQDYPLLKLHRLSISYFRTLAMKELGKTYTFTCEF